VRQVFYTLFSVFAIRLRLCGWLRKVGEEQGDGVEQ
jgi:hypothetical protein